MLCECCSRIVIEIVLAIKFCLPAKENAWRTETKDTYLCHQMRNHLRSSTKESARERESKWKRERKRHYKNGLVAHFT